jgi:CheY-like chemotaxis protein
MGKSALHEYATGNEHILLVDDEEMVILPEKMILERLGYRVTARTSNIEALETFRESPLLFDLVITDMTMPKMTGDLLARELTTIRPGVPVIICSGFNEKIPPGAARPKGVKDFLMKPVSISEMAATVRKILDAVQTG